MFIPNPDSRSELPLTSVRNRRVSLLDYSHQTRHQQHFAPDLRQPRCSKCTCTGGRRAQNHRSARVRITPVGTLATFTSATECTSSPMSARPLAGLWIPSKALRVELHCVSTFRANQEESLRVNAASSSASWSSRIESLSVDGHK